MKNPGPSVFILTLSLRKRGGGKNIFPGHDDEAPAPILRNAEKAIEPYRVTA